MTYLAFLELIYCIVSGAQFAIGVYVLLKNPRSRVNQAFFALAFGTVLWIGGIALLTATRLFIFDKVILYGGMFMVFGLYALSGVFPPAEKPLGKNFWTALIPFAAVLILIPFNIFIQAAVVHANGELEAVNGPAFPLLAATVAFYIVLSLLRFWRSYRGSHGLARWQMQYLFAGSTVFILAVFVCNLLLPTFRIFAFNFIGPIASIVLALATAYAIIRHQLMDIRVIIQRGILYSLFITAILAFYLVVLFALTYIAEERLALNGLISGLMTAIVGIFGLPPIERFFRRKTDSLFFKESYDYTEAMHALSETVHTHLRLNDLLVALSAKFEEILKASEVMFFIANMPPSVSHSAKTLDDLFRFGQPDALSRLQGPLVCSENADSEDINKVCEALRSYGMEIAAPIISGEGLAGLIALGPKKSGDPYTKEDFNLLTTFSFQAAMALRNSELFEQVEDYSRDLETKVKQRTEAYQQLIEDMEHSLQTPLSVIKGNLHLIRKSKNYTQIFDRCEDAVDRLSQYIKALLRIARLGKAPEPGELKLVNFSDVIDDVVGYLQTDAKKARIRIIEDYSPNIFLLGEAGRLEELVTNLIMNAIQYMNNPDKREIRVSLSAGSDGVILSVADTGAGIPKEDLPKLFTRFYTVQRADHGARQGNGLGLAICKRIVDRHRGTIEVESSLGKGSTFTVRFPNAPDAPIEIAGPEAVAAK